MRTRGRFMVILLFVGFLLAPVSVWGQYATGGGSQAVTILAIGWILGAILIALLAHHRFDRKWVNWLLVSILGNPSGSVKTDPEKSCFNVYFIPASSPFAFHLPALHALFPFVTSWGFSINVPKKECGTTVIKPTLVGKLMKFRRVGVSC